MSLQFYHHQIISSTLLYITNTSTAPTHCKHQTAYPIMLLAHCPRAVTGQLTPVASLLVKKNYFSTSSRLRSRVAEYETATQNQSAELKRPPVPHTLASDNNEVVAHDLLNSTDKRIYLSKGWEHPDVTLEELKSVHVAHFEPRNWSDRIAKNVLRFVRSSFDIVTGYSHPPQGEEGNIKYRMPPEKWLQRFIFLESVAGVPGMVGGMVRHLHSLRLLRRDKAWIETLLEEAYNERMHLLTFIKMTNPGWFMRLMILGAQGVFFNGFFMAYLVNPKICHRFVGYLEEEAVVTYSRCIEDIERGWYPEWDNIELPEVALQYWKMPKDSSFKDLLYYIRADESKHREVNHTFGNLNQDMDRNPYALEVPCNQPQPTKDWKTHNYRPVGWDREDIAA
ncbi:hypothetical protein TRVA0_053S00144 [Trichomonascus vanleenenianus]|uniref:alternative oxidase n=1 Tax=Trichomonascus vanleenenianus TaxID=2268995 RepID=UPI003ECB49DE